MDVADLVCHGQAVEAPQLRESLRVISKQAPPQRVAKARGVFVGGPVAINLLVVELVVKADLIEQPAVESIKHIVLALGERE